VDVLSTRGLAVLGEGCRGRSERFSERFFAFASSCALRAVKVV